MGPSDEAEPAVTGDTGGEKGPTGQRSNKRSPTPATPLGDYLISPWPGGVVCESGLWRSVSYELDYVVEGVLAEDPVAFASRIFDGVP